jgi:hypothetical protein
MDQRRSATAAALSRTSRRQEPGRGCTGEASVSLGGAPHRMAAKADLGSVLEANDFSVIDLGDLTTGSRIQQTGGPLSGLDHPPFRRRETNRIAAHGLFQYGAHP